MYFVDELTKVQSTWVNCSSSQTSKWWTWDSNLAGLYSNLALFPLHYTASRSHRSQPSSQPTGSHLFHALHSALLLIHWDLFSQLGFVPWTSIPGPPRTSLSTVTMIHNFLLCHFWLPWVVNSQTISWISSTVSFISYSRQSCFSTKNPRSS